MMEDITHHDEYVAHGRWRCSASPTGAHHWIEIGHFHHTGSFYCKWCFDSRDFPISYDSSVGFTTLNYGRGTEVDTYVRYKR